MNSNISALVNVLESDGIEYQSLHPAGNLIRISGTPHVFANHLTPFNRDVHGLICKDKHFQQLLLPEGWYPHTKAYLDPHTSAAYQEYVDLKSHEEIREDILKNFQLPLIIKANRLSMGHHVFLCNSSEEIDTSITKMYEDSKHYDYVLLAQEYLDIKSEYRVVYFDGQIHFMYLKDNSTAEFRNNLSPLHWDEAQAVDIQPEDKIWFEADSICQIITESLDIEYFGLDLAVTTDGHLKIIEINGGPGFAKYIRDCGGKKVQSLYRAMLRKLGK
jgi:carbamoylphosphate synthase large subunit